MKKVFLLTDNGEDFCFYSKIVNKQVIEYPVIASYEAEVDSVYLITDHLEINRYDVTLIKEQEIYEHIKEDDLLLFMNANMPLVKAKTIKKIFEKLDQAEMVVDEAELESGVYAIKAKAFIGNEDKNIRNALKNLYSSLKDTGLVKVKASKKFMLVKNYEDLSKADQYLRKSINKEYMRKNVFIESPETVTIEKGVEIGEHTRIEAGVRILGKTKIGKNCFIGFNSKIEDSIIHDNVEVFTSFVEKSEIEDYTNIGPYSRLRPNAHLKKHVHIGNFVEVKNSVVGEGTKAGHLAYIGDAKLGEGINVSCGVIFANYDGKFKHKAIVGDGAFLGSNVNIVAPINIEKDAYLAAGSTVTKDVKEGYLIVERAETKEIEGYMERKRERDKKKLKK